MRLTITRRHLYERFFILTAGLSAFGYPRSAGAAPTAVGLQCATNDGADPHRNFSINFTPGNNGWTQSEPGSTSDIFKTKSGNYVTMANTTSLRKNDPANTVVAVLRNFNPSSASQGEKGNDGKALETARIYEWTVGIVIP